MVRTDTYKEIVDLKTRCDVTWQDLADRLQMKYGQNVIDAAHRGTLPLVYDGKMTATDIVVRYTEDQIGITISLADEVRQIMIAIAGEGLLWRLKLMMNKPRRNDLNNLPKQDKRKEQEDEKQEDAGE